jgi:hypothetical protein
MTNEEKKLFTTAQAAEYLKLSPITIKRAVRDKILKGDLLNPRMRVFTKDELDAYAAIERKPGPKPKD